MHYTYVLESLIKPGEFYRGHTADLRQRLADHNAGRCHHSSKFKPWRIKFYAAFADARLAQKFEKYLKSGSGHAFAKRHFGLASFARNHVSGDERRMVPFEAAFERR